MAWKIAAECLAILTVFSAGAFELRNRQSTDVQTELKALEASLQHVEGLVLPGSAGHRLWRARAADRVAK
jgi:hypothetical protein